MHVVMAVDEIRRAAEGSREGRELSLDFRREWILLEFGAAAPPARSRRPAGRRRPAVGGMAG